MSLSLQKKTLFLVWGPPSHGPRSQVFSRELGIEELHFIYSTTRRGWISAPFRYAYQAVKTLILLFSKRPEIVFVQSPPSLAVLFVYLYCLLTGSHYLIDAHSAAFLFPFWTRPQWLYQFLARKAVATIVTNEYFQELVNKWGGAAFVLRDIPSTFIQDHSFPVSATFNVVVINSFGPDEPLREVLDAAGDLKDVEFYVTGRKKNANPDLLAKAPKNVRFTDFLPNEQYYALLASSQAILCLTTRNHTMQRGACEALWMGKPIITSDWPLLREYFYKGTVHVDNTPGGIYQGVLEMRKQYSEHLTAIHDLQIIRRAEWQEKIKVLDELIQQAG